MTPQPVTYLLNQGHNKNQQLVIHIPVLELQGNQVPKQADWGGGGKFNMTRFFATALENSNMGYKHENLLFV